MATIQYVIKQLFLKNTFQNSCVMFPFPFLEVEVKLWNT